MILDNSVIPFAPLFATKLWPREELLSIPVGMTEIEGEVRKKT
jgi:hypothetical protein